VLRVAVAIKFSQVTDHLRIKRQLGIDEMEMYSYTYLKFPIDVRWKFVSFIDPQVNAKLMIDATAQFVLLNVNIEAVGDVSAFAISGDQFIIPRRYIVLEWPARKKNR
jgi:hypothetical protein